MGGATGLLTADAYNNAIGDQAGLSSLEDYANTAALGGLMGGGLAGAGQVGGKLWAWYKGRGVADPVSEPCRFGAVGAGHPTYPNIAVGTYSKRPFSPDAAGGPIRKLSIENIRITNRGVDVVAKHLSRFEPFELNSVMIQRLRAIANGHRVATPVDLNFYSHELREFVRYRRLGHEFGDPGHEIWNDTHTATLEDYQLQEGPGVLHAKGLNDE